MVKVLFVCLGNICRSPTADSVFRQLLEKAGMSDRVIVDSAGTGDWHLGKAPDQRATAAAARRGYDLTCLRARQVTAADFDEFDHVLAMDHNNFKELLALAPAHHHDKIGLLLEFAPHYKLEAVPDPYFDGEDQFEFVLDLIEAASQGLLEHIKARHFS